MQQPKVLGRVGHGPRFAGRDDDRVGRPERMTVPSAIETRRALEHETQYQLAVMGGKGQFGPAAAADDARFREAVCRATKRNLLGFAAVEWSPRRLLRDMPQEILVPEAAVASRGPVGSSMS